MMHADARDACKESLLKRLPHRSLMEATGCGSHSELAERASSLPQEVRKQSLVICFQVLGPSCRLVQHPSNIYALNEGCMSSLHILFVLLCAGN